ncbi:MAG: WS/DGAT/MGAT family O-acyltransferase [Micromonosporaceae bacterium]
MRERLTPLDASFLYLEDDGAAPSHVVSLGLFDQTLDYQKLCGLVEQRLALAPRYRQKIKRVPGGLARPVWVDHTSFNIADHVFRSRLPAPGTEEQLRELVAEMSARRLDRRRPLWEIHLIEGLAEDRVAMLSKTHQAMVDGAAVDLTQVIYDSQPNSRRPRGKPWDPVPEPSDAELIADAVSDLARQPQEIFSTLRHTLADAGRAVSGVVGVAAEVLTAARPAPPSPFNVEVSKRRRFAGVATDLADYRVVHRAYDVSVTDVVLATITGALRSWLMMRGELLSNSSVVRAMVPFGVREGLDEQAIGSGSTRVSTVLVDLPIGELKAPMRLHQVAYALHTQRQIGHFVRAEQMTSLSGFAPPTLHALGAKAASRLSQRLYNLVVTNVPGPQETLYLAGSPLTESYPVPPLGRGQGLAIGVTSYRGGVCYGFNADRDSMPDLDVLPDLIEESLAELRDTV